jgi:hypothetical protein
MSSGNSESPAVPWEVCALANPAAPLPARNERRETVDPVLKWLPLVRPPRLEDELRGHLPDARRRQDGTDQAEPSPGQKTIGIAELGVIEGIEKLGPDL